MCKYNGFGSMSALQAIALHIKIDNGKNSVRKCVIIRVGLNLEVHWFEYRPEVNL